jgi:hypothetical protein
MKRRRQDPFADESTVRFDFEKSGIPMPIEDEDSTQPVDVEEMAAAARRSRHVPDPTEVTLAVEVPIGGGPPVTLAVHSLSATGAALAVPPGLALDLREDTALVVEVVVTRGKQEAVRARVPVVVGHHRPPRDKTPGGLSLRWTTDDPNDEAALRRVLAHVPTTSARR